MKKCYKCQIFKEEIEFNKDESQSDGLHSKCKLCTKIYYKKYWKKNGIVISKRSWQRNKEKRKLELKEAYKKNPEKWHKLAAKWRKENPGQFRAIIRRRQVAQLQRIPSWADLEVIKQFYIDCPKGMEVDHVIPLQGELVSGLHVLSNLQYLTKSENRSKSNKFELALG